MALDNELDLTVDNYEYDYEQELYEAIALLGFWDEGKATATPGGVVFTASDISGVPEFIANGMVSLDIRNDETRPVEFLTLDLVLATKADPNKADIIKQKLYDVNTGFKQGMFFMDDENNFCFETSFPVIRGDVETSLELFIAQYMDTMNYLDGVYPYLLRTIAHPEVADFAEYIVTMAGEEE